MTDATIKTAQNVSNFHRQFAERARLPEHHLTRAETFISTLEKLTETGHSPAPDVVRDGQRLLRAMHEETETYMFSAAILAGQEAASETDLQKNLARIEAGIQRLNDMSLRLKETLHTVSADVA